MPNELSVRDFIHQLSKTMTGSAVERSIAVTTLTNHVLSWEQFYNQQPLISMRYLQQDDSAFSGYKGIAKTDTVVDCGGTNQKCVSIIARANRGNGTILNALCLKASTVLLNEIFGQEDQEVFLGSSSLTIEEETTNQAGNEPLETPSVEAQPVVSTQIEESPAIETPHEETIPSETPTIVMTPSETAFLSEPTETHEIIQELTEEELERATDPSMEVPMNTGGASVSTPNKKHKKH